MALINNHLSFAWTKLITFVYEIYSDNNTVYLAEFSSFIFLDCFFVLIQKAPFADQM